MNRLVRDEAGFVLPTRVLALCVSAVAVAALVFIANDPDDVGQTASPAKGTPATSEAASPSATPTPSAKAEPKPVKRGDTYVVVFNNTRTKGLAGRVAATARGAGWNVVGTDNWVGTVDGTAIYYPPRLKRAAQEIGYDLGIKRLKPAVEPMQFDRLTVILTDDFRS